MNREEIARIIYDAFPFEPHHGEAQKPAWVAGGNSFRQDDARRAADTILALSAQGEPVAWRYQRKKGWRGIWRAVTMRPTAFEEPEAWTIEPLYTALPSSPAPLKGSLNSGESEPPVTMVSGAGEAIFAECAEIALEHLGAGKEASTVMNTYCRKLGYDEACRDIVEAIRTRASNRKTMDAVADAVQGEQK
jgi:hypothetical protein